MLTLNGRPKFEH